MDKNIKIGISKIAGVGKGVFAMKKISKGEIIERCHLLIIPELEKEIFNNSFLVNYLFYFGKNKKRAGLAMGLGSFYNHSPKPNAKFKIIKKREIIEFTAIQNIDMSEEITFDYRNGNNNNLPLWFEICL